MKLLDKYIAKTVLASIGLVTLMLAGLQIFILLVNQLDDIGHADFGIMQALIFVLLQMPYQVYLFFPMASLLGCLIGLSLMANHHELIVMRAAGMSIAQITQAVLKAAVLLIIVVTLTGETVIPHLSQWANDKRMQALSAGQALRTARAVWLRSHNDFIAVGEVLPHNHLQDVFQCRFDDNHNLVFARKIAAIDFIDGAWHATNADTTFISDSKTRTEHQDTFIWDANINPAVLSMSANEPDEMTLRELKRYLRVQKRSHQSASTYQLAYWQRLIQPITTVVMMVLAIPFIFGPLRSSTMGSKLLVGAVAGFSFHLINRFFGPISLVLQWPPIVAALAPTLLFAFLGIYLMRRIK